MKPVYKKYDANKLTAANFATLIPHKLYKYRSVNDLLYKTLEDSSLWFSSPADFNDPFDCRLEVSMGKAKPEILENLVLHEGLVRMKTKRQQQTLNQIMDNPVFYNDLMNKIHQIYINEKIGVCCLTEDPNSILMWAHYASSHTGICLEFEIERDGFLYNNVLPVQYKKSYPQFNLSKYKSQRRNLYTMHQQAICTKSILWEYEHEWRVIVDTGFGAYPFDKKKLTKVIFGARAGADSIKSVKETLEIHGYQNTLVCKAEPLRKTFGIKIKPL